MMVIAFRGLGTAQERLRYLSPNGVFVFIRDNIYCHLMVQLLEAWFLADKEALKAYYGQGFNPHSIPGNPNVEQIAKATVLAAMGIATRNTQKGEYRKIRDASRLLERISPAVVRAKSPHCDRLFTELSEQIQ